MASVLPLPKALPRGRAKPRPAKLKPAPIARKVALSLGGIGVAVLMLSVTHCTSAIEMLTGTHWTLSALLAIGIDAGMVACELADIVTDDREVKRWARSYVVSAVVMSMLLNAYAFQQHSPPGMRVAAVALGVAIPGLVFILGRVAGLLHRNSR